jgi:hypothetical protein
MPSVGGVQVSTARGGSGEGVVARGGVCRAPWSLGRRTPCLAGCVSCGDAFHHTATRLRDQPQAPEAPRRRRPCAGSSCGRTRKCADAVRRELASLAPAFSNGPKVCGGIADPWVNIRLCGVTTRRRGRHIGAHGMPTPTTTRLRVTRRTSRSSSWISRSLVTSCAVRPMSITVWTRPQHERSSGSTSRCPGCTRG